MKFLESNNSIIDHKIYFEVIEWQKTITFLKVNIITEFKNILQYSKYSIIENYLETILSELFLKFRD
jgi:hypothetical protein